MGCYFNYSIIETYNNIYNKCHFPHRGQNLHILVMNVSGLLWALSFQCRERSKKQQKNIGKVDARNRQGILEQINKLSSIS